MPEPRRDDPLERIRHLEWENRVWKALFFGLLSALMCALWLGGLGFGLHLHRQAQQSERRLEEASRQVEESERQLKELWQRHEEERDRLEQRLHEAKQEPEPLKERAP
jgi:hypothetical protein